MPPKWLDGAKRAFDSARFSVAINGEPTDIKLKDVSWQTAADKELERTAKAAGLVRFDGETDTTLRARIRAKLGQVYTATLAAPGRAPINLVGDPGEPNVYLNGVLQTNGADVVALNGIGAPVFDPSTGPIFSIGARAQVNYSNGLMEYYNRVAPGEWKLAGNRQAPRPPEVIRLNAEFRTANGDRVVLGSPVQCDIRTPSGRTLTYTTTSGQVREEREGRYSLQFTAQEPGTYQVRWAGPEAKLDTELVVTGTGGASTQEVTVEPPEPEWDAESRQRILDELEVDAADALRDIDATLSALDEPDQDA